VAHELEGLSFKEIAAETGVNVNTLLSRNGMRCCICASGCNRFTTSLRKHEEQEHDKQRDQQSAQGGTWNLPYGGHHRAVGEAVLQLWNWLLPSIFGWRQITYWQAVGILVLCRILFGKFGDVQCGAPNHRRRMGERWEKMTPEERKSSARGCAAAAASVRPAAEAKP